MITGKYDINEVTAKRVKLPLNWLERGTILCVIFTACQCWQEINAINKKSVNGVIENNIAR